MTKKHTFIFIFLLVLLLVDRTFTLLHFGFQYTDIDQVILWNGAVDYSKGIFYEPYFYGQAYNFMLESFLAVPLLWMNVPVYQALPLISIALSILPYIALGVLFIRRKEYFWANVVLAFPLLLPLDFNLMTSLSRGFVQAQLFIPFLFIPFFYPNRKNSDTLFFIASALCFIANQSSVLLFFPIGVYIFTHRYKDKYFYLKSLISIPILSITHFASRYYQLHPEKQRHVLFGMEINGETFYSTFQNFKLFENLFPILKDGAYFYLFLFPLALTLFAKKHLWKETIFLFSFFIILLLTFAIPKFQELCKAGDIYYSSSRLYLAVPIVFLLTLYFLFQKKLFHPLISVFLAIASLFFVGFKNYQIDEKIEAKIKSVVFPLAKNEDVIDRVNNLERIAQQHKVNIIINQNEVGWDYKFDIEAYAFHPLKPTEFPHLKSLRSTDDRRTWLYTNLGSKRNILLNGMTIADSLLKPFEHIYISPNQVVIKNNNLPIDSLLFKLDRKFGLTY